ncbi:hypothetical protein SHELI_v1c07140 [Spiroplasma helicoides]|uniref:Transmembrane protein n=1 Tax=Spiroplasma helicoides TaxID=216938 RepID=A0A1B3SL65_9MOLU|nr:hypothetical protein [Spiroplasma helicoides]AOG60663.1 hypothetical protein SHELI_v1c07140 [Spiroplasma helicoides]
MKDKNKDSYKNSLKEHIKDRKQAYKQQREDIVSEVQSGGVQKEVEYIDAKKLRWFDYLIIFGTFLALLGLSFIVSVFIMKDIDRTEYITTAIAGLGILVWLVMGWLRNNKTAKFYNDSRRRYQSTFTTDEGINRRKSKIIISIAGLMLITSIIYWIVVYA